ncbi:MAG TPA: hypothetical protein VIH87_10725 [Methylocella sp.]
MQNDDAKEMIDETPNRFPRGKGPFIAVSAYCAAVAALAGFVAFAGLRPLDPPPPSDKSIAAGSIACPGSLALAEPDRLQEQIEESRRAAAVKLEKANSNEAKVIFTGLQTQICRLILQNPMRGLAWAELLPTSPDLSRIPTLRASFYGVSYNFARLEPAATYWRVVFGSKRWNVHMPDERQRLLSDARTLAQIPFGNEYILQLALLGATGGPSLTAAYRDIVAELAPQWLEQTYDPYARNASGQTK